MTEVKTQFSIEIAKSTASFNSSSHFALYLLNHYNLIASLSLLEALFLNVTSDELNNCLFQNKKAKSSVG